MKSRALTLVLVATSALWSGGCGTVLNFASGEPRRYGGVAADFSIEEVPGFLNHTTPKGVAWFLAFWLADVCACGVADTLTLPIVICLEPPKPPEGGPAANKPPVKCGPPAYPAQFAAGAIAAPPPAPEPVAVLGKPRPLDHVERP